MAYSMIDQSLPGHRKTRRMARLLGIKKRDAVGCLVCLWGYALDNAKDGRIDPIGLDVIADVVEYDDPEVFMEALIDSGFVDRYEDGSLWLHDWSEWGGKYIAKKEQNAIRMQEARARDKDRTCNAQDGEESSSSPTPPTTPKDQEDIGEETNRHMQRTCNAQPHFELESGKEEYSQSFMAVYKKYPVKLDKQDAYDAFKAMKAREKALLDIAVNRIVAFLKEYPAQVEFTMHAGRFFKKGWRDWVEGEPDGMRTKAEADMRRKGGHATSTDDNLHDGPMQYTPEANQ